MTAGAWTQGEISVYGGCFLRNHQVMEAETLRGLNVSISVTALQVSVASGAGLMAVESCIPQLPAVWL